MTAGWRGEKTYLAGPAFLRLGPQQVVDEILGIVADVLPVPFVIDHAAGAALVDEVLKMLGSERGVAAKQGIGNDAERPEVDGLAVALLEHHLGGRIAERPSHSREHLILGPERLRDAKVCQDQFRIRCSGAVEEILGFEILRPVLDTARPGGYPRITHRGEQHCSGADNSRRQGPA